MNDYDKQQWQEQQAVRDEALEKQREKDKKVKARAARNAQRKLDRLRLKLQELGDLTEWEDEFTESVSERLDKYGSAFQDPEKGRRNDALSFAQKKVVSALNKKVKEAKRGDAKQSGYNSSFKPKSGFKNKSTYTPRVRHIEDDMPDASEDDVFIPEYKKPETPKRPFLRVVKNEDDQ